MAAGTNGICLRWCRAIAGVFELQLAWSEKDRESTSEHAKKGAPDSLELWHRKMLCKRFSIRNERWYVLQGCMCQSNCIRSFGPPWEKAVLSRNIFESATFVSYKLMIARWPSGVLLWQTSFAAVLNDQTMNCRSSTNRWAVFLITLAISPHGMAWRHGARVPWKHQYGRKLVLGQLGRSALLGRDEFKGVNIVVSMCAAACNPLGGNQDMDGRCSWAACLLNMFCLTWMIQEQSCRAKMPFVKKWPTCNYFATWQNMRIKLAKRLQDRPKDETTGLPLEIWSLWPGPLNCCACFEHMSAPHMSNSCPTSHESLHRWVLNACCWCLTCLTCQVPLRSLFWYLLGWRRSPWRAVQRGNLLHPPRTCCRPSALMTVCVGCSATLRMLPRPAVAIHLYSWCWHIGHGYKTWSPTTCPQHLHTQLFTVNIL